MKNIYLIRHCKAEGQEPEASLTCEGEHQAKELAKLLSSYSISLVITSPYKRAVDTIRSYCDLSHIPCITDARLQERVLSSVPMTDWMDKLRETYLDLDLAYEGGESSNEAMRRGMQVIEELQHRPECNAALITHGALMSLILKAYDPAFGFEEWLNLSNPDVYQIAIEEHKTTVSRIIAHKKNQLGQGES
ncbi:histidine phosphatase family protein [Paenibacillus albiflavus]|uniref:Histidine phosphatase family protein n=1 Tax=Paenibacillus albiflavus TaxID=2545760 RepID=A0A4R4EN00_9BACL|nr:histidine phosphatase family protein [Paenibacillus albiflavus]TCZ79871.1 histidine phosphatase family protein [Paenibacillus albiflavus]